MGQHEILYLSLSYVLGSVPTGFLIFWLTKKEDIREKGSGNTGATNINRTCGSRAAMITLIVDVLKGAIPVMYGLIHFKFSPLILGGGILAVIGHIYPVWLKFRGGKGVATLSGVFIAYMISPDGLFIFPSFALGFILMMSVSRYVSASSLAGITFAFFALLFTNIAESSLLVLLIVILIFIKHNDNITRIISGNEDKFHWRNNG